MKRNRRNLLTLARKHEAEALAKAKLASLPEREAVRRETPYTSWSDFLRHEAEQGNETALAVLRSRSEAVEPEAAPTTGVSQQGQSYAAITAIRAEYAEKQRQLQQQPAFSASGKQSLQAFLRMEQVAAEARAQGADLGDIKRRIDGKGVVIFSLESGGTIRDTGKELFFSAHDPTAERAAMLYAAKKWGKHWIADRGYIILQSAREEERAILQFPQKQHDISR